MNKIRLNNYMLILLFIIQLPLAKCFFPVPCSGTVVSKVCQVDWCVSLSNNACMQEPIDVCPEKTFFNIHNPSVSHTPDPIPGCPLGGSIPGTYTSYWCCDPCPAGSHFDTNSGQCKSGCPSCIDPNVDLNGNECSSTPICVPSDDKCLHPTYGTCSYYRDCAQKTFNCAPNEYPLGYGEKYCNIFSNVAKRLSKKGQKWIWDTMQCLQTSLISFVSAGIGTCSDLKNVAFESHSECYTKNGFCKLNITDLLIIAQSININEMLSPEGAKQIIETAYICILKNYKNSLKELRLLQ